MTAEAHAVAPVVLVTAVGGAEGSRAVAAALACADAGPDRATLFVDIGGRRPRPTLLASGAARALEERLVAHLPQCSAAARGQVCHLVVPADAEGIAAAFAAATVARGTLAALHVPPALLQAAIGVESASRPSAVLLRADLGRDRALVALAVRDLLERDLRVAVFKRALSWTSSRRALFGALPADALPSRLRDRLGVLP